MGEGPTWDVVTAAKAEVGVGGQPRLGEWGMPLIVDTESWVIPGVVIIWRVDEWGATTGEKLHIGDPFVALRESDWEARDGRTLCRRKLSPMGRGEPLKRWAGVPSVLPAGSLAAREIPSMGWCEACARRLVLWTAGMKALMAMTVGGSVQVRPVTWRSRSIWGVEGEEGYVGVEVDSDGEDEGPDDIPQQVGEG